MKSKQRNSFMNFSLFNLEGMPSKVVEVRDGGLAQLGERLPCKQEVSTRLIIVRSVVRVHFGPPASKKARRCTLKTEQRVNEKR